MAWAQLKRRTMIVNKVGPANEKVPPLKILSAPVRHLSNRVIGFLALFNLPDAPDFELRETRLTIPHANPALRSLNLSTAAGIACYEALRQIGLPPA